MKLFQRLLVAPAALGLMAPVAANADSAFTSTTTLGGNAFFTVGSVAVSYTHLRAHETDSYLVCRLLLEKKK